MNVRVDNFHGDEPVVNGEVVPVETVEQRFEAASANEQLAQQLVPEKPFVEVSGTSETEITPDIIELTINLREYVEGKNKMDVEKQEEKLKSNLKELAFAPYSIYRGFQG